MPIVPVQARATLLIVTSFAAAALPHARAIGAAAKLVGPAQPVSIIMLARPQPPTPDAAQISAWIHDLAGGNAASQKHAEPLLIAAGSAALPALQKALHTPRPVQARQRLRAALNTIAIRNALRGPLVSVRAKNGSIKSILGVLCDQVGMYTFFPPHNTWAAQRLNIDVQRQPFWKVLLRIARTTGISPTSVEYGPSAGLFFDRPGLFTHGSVAIHGTFALVIRSARQITIYGSQQTSGQGHRELVVKYSGLYVPTPHVLFETSPLMVRLAEDDQHRILAVPGPIGYSPSGFDDINSTVFGPPWHVTLGRPSSKAEFLALLQTRLTAAVATDAHMKRCRHLAGGKATMHIQGLNIKFSRPTRAGNQWKELMNVSVPPGLARSRRIAALMARLTNSFPTPFHFHGSHGQLLRVTGGGGYSDPTHYQTTFVFSNGQPRTVEVKVYRHITILTVPFEFQHIPLLR